MESNEEQKQQNINYECAQQQQDPATNDSKKKRSKAYVKILEQPAGKALRFRYECEGRSAGSIPGVNSTSQNKTYPTIEIVGYKGRAVVVVSCVTKDEPYRPHPHNLVGKDDCKKGVCTREITPETMRVVFSNLGIQCVKKKDIEAALKFREEIRVDPFKTGFKHRFHPSAIDLNSVRLCFQVFIESVQNGRCTHPLAPVVSDPIYDKKSMCDLVISRLCSCSATVLGNTQIILLCEKVAKEDISVRFFEEKNGQTIWEAFGDFQHTDVHKQTAISFRTPPYHNTNITEPAKVFIQLRRPSDGITSEALPFEYIPLDSDPVHLKRKRRLTNGDPVHFLQKGDKNPHQANNQDGREAKAIWWNNANIPAIKSEPSSASPQPQALSSSSMYSHNVPAHCHVSPAVPAETRNSQLMISPSQQYHTVNAAGVNNTSLRNSNNTFSQHTQQQQQYYHGNSFGNAGGYWESFYAPLTTAARPGANNANWNPASTSNHYNSYHQLQHQYPPHLAQNGAVITNNNGTVHNTTATSANTNIVSNGNLTENGLSNLLNLDSEEYVQINSEDQQMIRLSTGDLQNFDINVV